MEQGVVGRGEKEGGEEFEGEFVNIVGEWMFNTGSLGHKFIRNARDIGSLDS